MDAVLFDLDGVILEGRSLRAATGRPVAETATENALADLGIVDPPREFLEATRWGSYDDLVDATETFDIDADPGDVWPKRERYLSKMEREFVRSGKRKSCEDVGAIDRLAEEPVSLGVVSNARHATVNCVVEHLAFDTANTAVRGQYLEPEDWYRRKPEPDYINEALDRTGADDALYVGDSETDVVAADRAGIDSAFIRREHNHRIELDHDPTFEIETLHALLDII